MRGRELNVFDVEMSVAWSRLGERSHKWLCQIAERKLVCFTDYFPNEGFLVVPAVK